MSISREVRELLEDEGVTDYEVIESKHIKVRFYHRGRKRTLVLARSPSDNRYVQNIRATLRRLLREDQAA